MLTKYAEIEAQVLDVQYVPANAGHRRLARARRQAHRAVFNYDPRPGYIYVRSRAISSRCNDNFDEFPAEEIKKAYRTFVGKPVFVNHHNADHRRARGVIIDAALHEDTNPDGSPDTWAEVLMEVDAKRFPVLAREVLAGNIARTSMGTDVQYSVCTACGNKAYTPADYCQHIPKLKGMKHRRINAATGTTEEVLIAERCYGLGFFENSLLVEDPADPTAVGWVDYDASGLSAAASKTATVAVETSDLGQNPDPVSVANHALLQQVKTASRKESGQCVRCNPLLATTGSTVLCDSHAFMRDHGTLDFPSHNNFDGGLFDYPAGRSAAKVAFPSRRDLVDQLEGHQPHGEQVTRPRPSSQPVEDETPPGSRIFHVDHSGPAYGLGGEDHLRELADEETRRDERQHRQQWRQYHPGEPYVRTHDEQVLYKRTHPHPTVGAKVIEKGSEEYKRHYQRGWATSQRGGSLTAADDRGEPDAWYDGYMDHACDRPKWSTMYHPSVEAADAALDAGWTPPRTRGGRTAALQTQAYGETKAPAKVDTMRAESCPVCGDDEGFSGEKCNVCGYTQPPPQFRDPDLQKARQVDLRQEQAEQAGADPEQGLDANGNPVDPSDSAAQPADQSQPETLECTNCGEVFSAEGDAATSPDAADQADPAQAQETENQQPGAAQNSDGQTPRKPEDLSDLADKSDAELGLEDDDEDPKKDPDQDAAETAQGEGRVTPETAEDPTPAPPGADDEQDDEQGDDNPLAGVDGEIAPNMTCPVCGQGTLVPVATKPAGEEPDLNEVGQTPAPQPNKVSSRTMSKETVDMNQPNPAQQRRNRIIEAIREQQNLIEAQRSEIGSLRNAVATLAVAARIDEHPTFAPIVRAAGLQRRADSNQNPEGAPATTTEEAKKPDATDDVNSVGAAPGSVNSDVTPKATTDVQNTNVAADDHAPLSNLTDVTAPTQGTDAVYPDAASGEGRVTVSAPSNDTFDTKTWAAKQRGEERERFTASLRLARLQVESGLAEGEDLTVAQGIFDGQSSLGEIEAQVSTLSAVAQRRQASAPSAEQTRRLVPRSANRQGITGVSAAPLSLQTSASVTQREGEDEWLVTGGDLG